MPVTNKRLLISESRSDSNRYTPCRGKSDQHDTYASHASPCTSGVHFLRAVPIRGNLLRVIDRFRRIPLLPRKKSYRYNPQHDGWPIHGFVPSFSPKPTNKAVDLSQASVDDKLLGLLGPYHQHAIGTFNTCSWVPTTRSLTGTGGGYHIETPESPQHSPRSSVLSVPLIP
jgi:hypothetical protein